MILCNLFLGVGVMVRVNHSLGPVGKKVKKGKKGKGRQFV